MPWRALKLRRVEHVRDAAFVHVIAPAASWAMCRRAMALAVDAEALGLEEGATVLGGDSCGVQNEPLLTREPCGLLSRRVLIACLRPSRSGWTLASFSRISRSRSLSTGGSDFSSRMSCAVRSTISRLCFAAALSPSVLHFTQKTIRVLSSGASIFDASTLLNMLKR